MSGWLDPLNGNGYQFWSGIGSGSPLLVAVAVWWRKHNCHVQRCWRLHWKDHDGHALCKRHHPDDPPRAADIKRGGAK